MIEKNIVVMASGRGTNLQAIIDATQSGFIPGKITLVISDNPDAFALIRAQKAKIPTLVLDFKSFTGKKAYEDELLKVLKKENPSIICLAGYMRIVGKAIISQFYYRILNIHPSLLPAFPGLDAQKQALEYGVKVSGCTVHFVDEGMDSGPIILQAPVLIKDNDTVESLSQSILEKEHEIYCQAIKMLLEDKLMVQGRTVRVKG
ncbi:MAG TPA: phosphoribosylglycinamide formyltransferase [Atribacter sp.]|jgi:phosphoribosylglycinamide formyltransferase-1|uniref:Phosphoribosylglycinamide formyltransferase n=1 Tax=Candidatus Atribacter allofermentans TaxID=1852833 RepID=A0A1V5SI74_9BACT|nr:phosphoribosylglycinamide formyltransferase [Atribacter sp.]OQA54165.1 MAG: Phosphoribosylglycinamide formyltransferase [Candidatus Atribacteria bacterium ADurb.Bin276]HHT09459.1 phosphoribosylglycinamide formyltransferase [Candidatus Atribacteria bacterium]HQK82326.1 phosphoribosylglycinamide formyltransferase [Atribacter sp.]